jgi:hypothetical protein
MLLCNKEKTMKNHKLLVFLLCVSSSLFGLEWDPNWNRADFPTVDAGIHPGPLEEFKSEEIFGRKYYEKIVYDYCFDSTKLSEVEDYLSSLERISSHDLSQAIRDKYENIDAIASGVKNLSYVSRLRIDDSILILRSFFISERDLNTPNLCNGSRNGVKVFFFTVLIKVERVKDRRYEQGVKKISMAFYKGRIPYRDVSFLDSIGERPY